MPDLLQLFDKGAEIAGIKDDIDALEGLVALGKKWGTAEWPNDLPSLEKLLADLVTDADSDAVKQAMGKLGLEMIRTKVGALLKKVSDTVADLPQWVKTLATRIADVGDGKLSWKPLDKKDAKVPVGDKYALSLSGSFELSCAAATEWDEMSAAGKLMHIGLDGSVGAKAGAEIPVDAFTIKGSANAAAALGLDYYFKPEQPDGLYGIELARRALQVPDPFDYAATWRAFGHAGYMGSSYSFTASAGASIEVSLGKLIDDPNGLKLDLSAKVTVSADIKHDYLLTLRRGPDLNDRATILAALSRKDSDSRTLGVQIGLTVDAPTLRAKVQELIKDALAEWDEGLKTVRPFLSPGTYLQDAVGVQIGKAADKFVANPTLRAALVSDLKGVFGINTSNHSKLTGWLKTAISGAVARRSAALIDKPEAVVAGVIADLKLKIPAGLPPEIVQEATKLIDDEVDALVAKAKEKIDDVVKGLWGEYQHRADDLGKMLGRAGQGSTKAVKSLDDAFGRVRDLLEKCNTLVHDVAEKASAAVEKKASIALHAQIKRSRELQVKISGRFLAGDQDAPEIFGELTWGDLPALVARIQANGAANPVKPAAFEIDGDSQIKLVETDDYEEGYEVVLFGFGAEGTTKITASATAILDANGNVQIDSKGELDKRFKGGGEAREVSFADVLNVAIGRAAEGDARPSVTSTIKLGVTLSYRDDQYSAKKLDGFLKDLEDDSVRFIDKAKGEAARAKLGSWIKPGGKDVDAEIKAELWFDKDVARRMLRLDADAAGNAPRGGDGTLTQAVQEAIAEIGLKALEKQGVIDRKKLENAYRDFKLLYQNGFNPPPPAAPAGLIAGIVAIRREYIKALYPENRLEFPDNDLALFDKAHGSLNGLIDIIDLAGRAYLASPPKLDGSPAKWTLKTYRQFQKRIVDGSKFWLRLNQRFLFFTGDGVSPNTIAFMAALEELAGGIDYPVTLSLTNYSDEDKPETVAL